MEDRDIYRVFEQVKPTRSQEEAMLDMLLHGGSFVSPDNLPALQNWLSKQ